MNIRKCYLLVLMLFALNLTAAMAWAGDAMRLLPLQAKGGQHIRVPAEALVYRNGIPGVFVARDGEARFRMVRTGRQTGNTITVLSGLFGDETLVLADPQQLHDGMALHANHNAGDL